jgi:hypothetical protein
MNGLTPYQDNSIASDFVSERLDGQVLAFVSGLGGHEKHFVAFFNDENGTISFNS